jgi:hypothetical protein
MEISKNPPKNQSLAHNLTNRSQCNIESSIEPIKVSRWNENPCNPLIPKLKDPNLSKAIL